MSSTRSETFNYPAVARHRDSEELVGISYDEAQQIRAVDTGLCMHESADLNRYGVVRGLESRAGAASRGYDRTAAKWLTYAWCYEMRFLERARASAWPQRSELVGPIDFGEAWETLRHDLPMRQAFMMCANARNPRPPRGSAETLINLVQAGVVTKEQARTLVNEMASERDVLEADPAWQFLCAHFPNPARDAR